MLFFINEYHPSFEKGFLQGRIDRNRYFALSPGKRLAGFLQFSQLFGAICLLACQDIFCANLTELRIKNQEFLFRCKSIRKPVWYKNEFDLYGKTFCREMFFSIAIASDRLPGFKLQVFVHGIDGEIFGSR